MIDEQERVDAMPVNDYASTRGTIMERHAQTIIVAVLLALLLWTGTTLMGVRDDVTTLKVQVSNMEGQLRSASDDRFRASDWRREREIIDARFNRVEAMLEKHVDTMERRNGK
jgi:hypothetical protein